MCDLATGSHSPAVAGRIHENRIELNWNWSLKGERPSTAEQVEDIALIRFGATSHGPALDRADHVD
jgi:hypothetical protein